MPCLRCRLRRVASNTQRVHFSCVFTMILTDGVIGGKRDTSALPPRGFEATLLHQLESEDEQYDHLPRRVEAITSTLNRWKDDLDTPGPTPKWLIYTFQTEYEGPNPSLDVLTELDKEIADALRSAVSCATGFHLYVSTMERRCYEAVGYKDYEAALEAPPADIMSSLCDMNGVRVSSEKVNFPIREGTVLSVGPLDNLRPVKEGFASAIAVTIVPDAELAEFLGSGCAHSVSHAKAAIGYLRTMRESHPDQPLYKAVTAKFCVYIIKAYEMRHVTDAIRDVLYEIVATALLLGSTSWFVRGLGCFGDSVTFVLWDKVREVMQTTHVEHIVER
ncbi:hypothetical protein M011DRAFT_172226 [Sporormia fimetaria CBS 119925]|uniref:Uncharacterized protein n=1 Tax=Sporormia fimetaria CBS 119925 TaxID=1340428 RepID=A0A6A6V1I1_9PLEO|nr:hypothetical protein M011DRAFT_172226 [Sporormia fimetaria CBS 119925]